MSTDEQVQEEPLAAPIAPLWRRAAAETTDLAAQGLVVAAGLIAGLGPAVPLLWLTYCVGIVYVFPPSPGKRALGLHVVRSDDSPCTRKELLRHELLPFVAATTLFVRRAALWTWSAAFDGEYRRSPQDHVWDTCVVYCPELSGEVREADDSDPHGGEGAADAESEPAPDDGDETGRLTLWNESAALLAASGTVHAASSEGSPLCRVRHGTAMVATDRGITCKRCVAMGGTAIRRKGADAR